MLNIQPTNIEYSTRNIEYPTGRSGGSQSLDGTAIDCYCTRRNECRISNIEFRIVRCKGVLISRTGSWTWRCRSVALFSGCQATESAPTLPANWCVAAQRRLQTTLRQWRRIPERFHSQDETGIERAARVAGLVALFAEDATRE